MQVFQFEDLTQIPEKTAVCLGTFDGVHLGHQALLQATVRSAKEKGLVPGVFTFDLPPAFFLSPDKKWPVLTDISEKSLLIRSFGIQFVVYYSFDRSMADMTARAFFEDVLIRRLNAAHVVIGFHYHFGRKAEGNADTMRALCEEHGISLEVVPPVQTPDGKLVSSTAIRQCLLMGDQKQAEAMLNRALSPREAQMLGGKYHG